LCSFQKDKSPSPDGFTVEFYLGYFDILGNDLLRVVEYSMTSDKLMASFNANFIALIPKIDNPTNFDQFKPISLCNNIYKIISKLIATRLKDTLSTHISPKQFGFLQGRQIHEEIGLTQEGLHSIHTSNQ
jgi:hypothetical protein